MLKAKQNFAELYLVEQSFTHRLIAVQQSSSSFPTTLYIDKYLSASDSEFPKNYSEHVVGYFCFENFNLNPKSLYVFSLLYSNKIICKCIDETCENFYYILYDKLFNDVMCIIVKYSFADIFQCRKDMELHMRNLVYPKSQDIQFNVSYINWIENYKISISEWISCAITQNISIQKLNAEIQALKGDKAWDKCSKDVENTCYSFGECLLCCDRAKSIVFLPCGHVVACLQCTVKNLKIELNRKVKEKGYVKICPLCKGAIEEAREIII